MPNDLALWQPCEHGVFCSQIRDVRPEEHGSWAEFYSCEMKFPGRGKSLCACGGPEDNVLRQCAGLFIWFLSSGWGAGLDLIYSGRLYGKSQGSSSLYLPNSGIISECHSAFFLMGSRYWPQLPMFCWESSLSPESSSEHWISILMMCTYLNATCLRVPNTLGR